MSGMDYDPVAPGYHRRYEVEALTGVATALRDLAAGAPTSRALEVGCGTGRWLAELGAAGHATYGLDRSKGMLVQARKLNGAPRLTQGTSSRLPFESGSFGMVFAVNAFHHFDQPHAFLAEARRLLGAGGKLSITGMDPHAGLDRWYVYDYFDETRALDLGRFPSVQRLGEWMRAAGLESVEARPVEHTRHEFHGRDVLGDHFLQKDGTSQLTLLSDETYARGLARIESALTQAEAAGEDIRFTVDLRLWMVVGLVPTC